MDIFQFHHDDDVRIEYFDGSEPNVVIGWRTVASYGSANDKDAAERLVQDIKHFMRVYPPLIIEFSALLNAIDFLWAYPMFAPHIDAAKQYATRRRAALQRAMDSIQVADGVVWLDAVLGDRDGDGAIRRRIVSFAALF